jgi:AP-3 complex subunit delta-1
MIRKDLNSQNQYDAGVTLSGLACFINQDLARDLANDLMTLVCILLIIFEFIIFIIHLF